LSVPPDDPQALLSGILEVMDSPRLQAQMGAAGREYVQEQYSLEDVAERLCSLYYRLANTK
jgi:glycosyltransferase involved in cell wall biosynthesis